MPPSGGEAKYLSDHPRICIVDAMKNEPCDMQTNGKKKGRFCTSLYILGTCGDVAGFLYE